jgi:hypothetical protein
MNTKSNEIKKVAKKYGKKILNIELAERPSDEELRGMPLIIKSLEEIKEAYDNGEYKTKLPYPSGKKLKPTDFIDKSKSVTWNEEEIEKRNNELDEAYKAYRTDNNRLSNKLSADVVAALMNEYNLNEEQAKLVEGRVYSDHHSYMGDYFLYLDEFGEFAKKLIEMK